jgi:hypothetical protein
MCPFGIQSSGSSWEPTIIFPNRFNPRKVVARVKNIVKRAKHTPPSFVRVTHEVQRRGELEIDRTGHEVRLKDAALRLTPIEYRGQRPRISTFFRRVSAKFSWQPRLRSRSSFSGRRCSSLKRRSRAPSSAAAPRRAAGGCRNDPRTTSGSGDRSSGGRPRLPRACGRSSPAAPMPARAVRRATYRTAPAHLATRGMCCSETSA